jgi:2-isopropylmalate synthase
MAIVEAARPGMAGSTFGAGVSKSIVTASALGIINEGNRLEARGSTFVQEPDEAAID